MDVTSDARSGHKHHWTIAEANGPISAGVCKSCSAQRDFSNWLAATDFTGGDESSNTRDGGGRERGLSKGYAW